MKQLCAIVLAAGLSSRMGENKLLMDYKGRPMSEYILQNLKHNSMWLNEVLVVGRLQQTKELAERYGFNYVHNSQPERGMGHSLALGVQAAAQCDGFLLALSDMPDLKTGTIHTLCQSFNQDPLRITVPVYGGRRGNPVLFPASYREQLSALDGDKGGRDLIRREQQNLARVQIYDAGILRDIDTKSDFYAK
ncbi:nucleotidyltransferase family protein [Hydrogenoanaerobacterium sp.]|uniref:nucleotidyltransferase family protein n=1 Tax=Hydrogenoanaerobacterium sp. TaxID=2953763 RepID=UPI00289C959F|nr:nucleotidyltransferase family protein [Hydrogenoanaerobacterium sp.]